MKIPVRRFYKWIAVFSTILIIAGALWWHISLNPRFHPVIDKQVYRSAQLSPSRLDDIIRTYGIRTVIALIGAEKGETWYENEMAVADRHQVQLINLAFGSHELPQYNRLNQLVDVLQSIPRPILLHCYRGADRSGMASAIALILYNDPPLDILEKQFSWRFGVIPYSDSIGVLFFEKYVEWLQTSNRPHNRNNFLEWIRNHYVDAKGNIEYDIDSINGKGFEESMWNDLRTAEIKKGEKHYIIRGWAVDYRRLSQVARLRVGIGGTFHDVEYTASRPNLPAFLGLTGSLDPRLPLGWECGFDDQDLHPGCHVIQLSIGDADGFEAVVNTRIQVCIDSNGK
jgi:hypothetical protein